jgi:glucose/arabinose dehydrogenase
MDVTRASARIIVVCLAVVCATACDDTPEPPDMTPAPVEDVTGTERIGWMQSASDAVELSTFGYAIYVDGVRSELAGVACQKTAASPDFECSAPLPELSPGVHTLELAAFVVDGQLLESARSAPIQVNRTSAATTLAPPAPGPGSPGQAPPAGSPGTQPLVAPDGQRLRLETIAEGLARPTDLAFLPDGRVLVAEEGGSVRVVTPDGRMLPAPALTIEPGSNETRLLSIAADARGIVYAIYARRSPSGRSAFTLASFRERANVLSGEIVLLDDIQTAEPAAASVRIGPDGKLFVAFDDRGDARLAGDFGSLNGKILRLNPDGTTPGDQAGFSPVYAAGLRSPRGLDWRLSSALLWIADGAPQGSGELRAVGIERGTGIRGVTQVSYALPRGTPPSGIAVYRGSSIPSFAGSVLIASDEGRQLLRVRFDPAAPTKALETERLLRDTIGGIRAVSVSPSGVIYLATANAIATLAAANR